MRMILAAVFWGAVVPAAAQDTACLACHGEPGFESSTGRRISVDETRFQGSVHGGLGCTGCHSAVQGFPHPEPVPPPDCASCHDLPAQEVSQSAHSRLGSPACASCHGPAHAIPPAADASSPVRKRNLPSTCGVCHANPDFLQQHGISFARPVDAYRRSVHGRAVERGNDAAPACSDCHASHAIFAARDPRSTIYHWKVPETCGSCHTPVQEAYRQSIHGQAVLRGSTGAPVCTDCHGEHNILAPSEAESLVNPARVSRSTCGPCHADERLAERFNLPLDKVPAFEDSYHGLASRAGSQTVANCASCHGVHNILPSTDPRSMVHAANLRTTCGKCHPGAGERFALGPIHVLSGSVAEHVAVKWIRRIYLVLIPLIAGLMFFHNAADFLSKLVRPQQPVPSEEQVAYMNLHFRIAHWMVLLSFPTLVATGFALKFPEAWWAAPLLHWESRWAFRGTLHRIAGIVLIVSLVYHAAHLLLSSRDRTILRSLWPRLQDLRDFWSMIGYNVGLRSSRPVWGKFGYVEKAEYWAFVWGSVLMALTGFLLWFNNFTLRYFPKWIADVSTAVHYYEAILASLAILIWHFYAVIFDPDIYPMDRAWLTGKTSVERLRRSRPGYAQQLLREQRLLNTKAQRQQPEANQTGLEEGRDGEGIGTEGPATGEKPP